MAFLLLVLGALSELHCARTLAVFFMLFKKQFVCYNEKLAASKLVEEGWVPRQPCWCGLEKQAFVSLCEAILHPCIVFGAEERPLNEALCPLDLKSCLLISETCGVPSRASL